MSIAKRLFSDVASDEADTITLLRSSAVSGRREFTPTAETDLGDGYTLQVQAHPDDVSNPLIYRVVHGETPGVIVNPPAAIFENDVTMDRFVGIVEEYAGAEPAEEFREFVADLGERYRDNRLYVMPRGPARLVLSTVGVDFDPSDRHEPWSVTFHDEHVANNFHGTESARIPADEWASPRPSFHLPTGLDGVVLQGDRWRLVRRFWTEKCFNPDLTVQRLVNEQ